jgi:integrase
MKERSGMWTTLQATLPGSTPVSAGGVWRGWPAPAGSIRLSAPDNSTWLGRRYQTLLTLAVQTGQRVSELTRLARHDITWAPGHTFVATARDRKDRATPLPAHT